MRSNSVDWQILPHLVKYWGNVGPVSPRGCGTQSASNSHFQHLISWLMCLFFLFLWSLSCDGSLFQILMKLSKFASSLYSAVNWALRITFFSLSLSSISQKWGTVWQPLPRLVLCIWTKSDEADKKSYKANQVCLIAR